MADESLTDPCSHFDSMTNAELRAELKRHGASTTGNKKQLLAKLHEIVAKEKGQNSIQPASTDSSPMKSEKQPLLETDPVSNVMKMESEAVVSKHDEEEEMKDRERLGDQSKSTSLSNHASAESESIVEETSIDQKEQYNNGSNALLPSDDMNKSTSSETIQSQTDSDNTAKAELNTKASDESSSTSNKENIQKREIDEEKPSPIYKKLKRNDFVTQQSQSSALAFIKGLPRSNQTRMNLSLSVLQTLIPDVNLLAESVTNDDLDRYINDTMEYASNESKAEPKMDQEFISNEPLTIGDLVDQTQQRTRTVVLDRVVSSTSSHQDLTVKRVHGASTTTHHAPSDAKGFHDEKLSAAVDEPIRVKEPSKAVGKPTRTLHITGLTRPFALLQLRELLRRYGSVADDHIWLDKVKSQCLVLYKTVEEAQNARQALDGCRWPLTNPKTMSIRYARQEEFNFSKTKNLPPDQMTLGSMDEFMKERSPSPMDDSPERVSTNTKSKQRKENQTEKIEQPISGFLISEEEPTVERNEEPPKTLEDYFRKTVATPPIYWLPLTEEQVTERDKQKAERRRARQERDEKEEKDDDDDHHRSTFKDKPHSNSDRSHHHRRRRSSSSREKHRQRSPHAKRDAKRY